MPKFQTRYDRRIVSIRFEEGSSLTVQDVARQCDINYIVGHYKQTGVLPSVGASAFVKREPFFGDFSNCTDFQSIQNTLNARKEAFDTLPARVRARFKNDPNNLLKFIEEAKTEDSVREGVELGIFDKSSLDFFRSKSAVTASPEQGAGVTGATAESGHLA